MANIALYGVLALAVVASFWAAIMEATYLTVKPLSLYAARRDGSRKAKSALAITSEKTKLVSVTTLIDTLANVALASSIGLILSEFLGPVGWLVSVLLGSVVIMVFLILVPKAMGIENSVAVAIWLAPASSAVITVLSPIAIPLTNLSTRISQAVYGRRNYNPTELADEFEDLTYMLEEDGHIEPDAGRLLRSSLNFSSYAASSAATKIEKIVSIRSDARVIDALKLMGSSLHPRLPVHEEGGEYLGAVTFRSLARAISEDRLSDPVVNYVVQPARVEGDESIAVVADRMSRAGTAIAFVYEGGKVTGVITLSDLLERLLGIGIR